MSPLLTLPLLAISLAFPWFGKLPAWKSKPRATTVAADTLPPVWRPASRLALQSELVRPTLPALRRFYVGLQLREDPRRLRVSFDADSATLSTGVEMGSIPLGGASRLPLGEFARDLPATSFEKQWLQSNRERLNSLGQYSSANVPQSGMGLSVHFPSPLPQRFRSILGPGSPALTLRGTESIRLSGQSNWTNQQIGPLGRKQSLFPSLDMQQDLDIQLEGQLSDRIKVNLLQNTGIQVPLANRIAINYKGDEDDLVQALDLGNTNLTLPGTQYVSYSGKNEGLFGAKATTRIGPLDFTMLASKQEGRSERAAYAGGASSQKQSISDHDWIHGRFFFLYEPNGPSLYIPPDSVQVYLDDANAYNDVATGARTGRAYVDPSTTPVDTLNTISVRGSFAVLNYGADLDYEINRTLYGPLFPVLHLARDVTYNQAIAVSYYAYPVLGVDGQGRPILGDRFRVGGTIGTESPTDTTSILQLKLVRPPANKLKQSGIGFDTTDVFVQARELELKNVYQLPGQRIDPQTFKLSIRKGRDDPPVTTFRTAATGDTALTFLEAVGLDNFDETTGQSLEGHDGRVDGTLPSQQNRYFVDFENGLLMFYDLRPFAPRLYKPFESSVANVLFRRARLDGPVDSPNEANPAPYDVYTPLRDVNTKYLIDVELSAQRATGEINLGRTNILEGSEKVTVSGVEWVRNRDYEIDYDLGRLTLKKQLGATENLSVDYSYAPLFAQAGRTLVGSAFKLEGRDKLFGGAFMYESKGAQDLRPRLGEEPSRSVIGDLNTDWTFRPDWVTRLVDALPGLRTTAQSEFRFQGEVGASFPNPNTRNEVYVDDMEGVRDAVSVSLDRGRWRYAAPPRVRSGGIERRIDEVSGRKLAELHWYSPASTVLESDLKPKLTEAQGSKNRRLVLAMSVPRRPLTALPTDTLWTGLTYVLDQQGFDLSRSQFIELWVSDWADYHSGVSQPRVRGRNVRLNIDLGVVSEDQQRVPNRPANNKLDTEDQGNPPDGQLTIAEGNNEDTGFDGVDPDTAVFNGANPLDPRNLDLVTANGDDPAGDRFETIQDSPNKEDIDPRRYVRVNGTEENHNLDPLPDTEDMNLNGTLDRDEDFFRYTIDLGDPNQRYLITDVQRDFPDAVPPPAADNGWRRYRIPLTDSLRTAFGNPNLSLTRHVRVWLDGLYDGDGAPDSRGVVKPLVMLGGLEIVGSRWQSVALTDSQKTAGTTQTLNSVNSVDNAERYVAPFDPGRTRSGSQELARREQSVALEFTRFQPGDTLEAYKTFSIDENYSRYGTLNWYAAAFDVDGYIAGADTLYYFVRFASDEQGRNYYEYKSLLPPSSQALAIAWREVRLALTELSNVKLRSDFPTTGDILYRVAAETPGDSIVIRGRPSFTRLRRVSFGLLNPLNSRVYDRGELWFDELRATDVAKDRGTAQRITTSGRFANLANYNISWDARDADFITVGQSRGSGTSNDQFNFTGGLDPSRFVEGTGIALPLNFTYSRNTQKPRFTAGDDVVRTGALADASVTRTETRGFSTNYARTWGPRSNPFLKYTVGGVTANFSRNESESVSPSGASNSRTTNLNVAYAIAPRELVAIGLPLTKARLRPLPERLFWNYSSTRSDAKNYTRSDDGSALFLTSAPSGRTGTLAFGADTRPLDFFHHHVDALRNLELDEPLREKVAGVNLGRVVNWRQNMDAAFGLNKGDWLTPRFSWNSSYAQDNRPELSPRRDLSVRAVSNTQSMSVSWSLPFDRLAAPPKTAPGGQRFSPGGRPIGGPVPSPGATGSPPRAGTLAGAGVNPAAPGGAPAVTPGGPPPGGTGADPSQPAGGPEPSESEDVPRELPGLTPPQAAPAPPIAAADSAAADTTRRAVKPARPPITIDWRSIVSRLGRVSWDASWDRNSNFSRLTGTPSLGYLFGLSDDPGLASDSTGRVREEFGNVASFGTNWRTSARTRVTLPWDASVNTNAEWTSRRSESNRVLTKNASSRFPNFEITYGRLPQALRLQRFFTNPQMRTSYSRSITKDYRNGQSTPTGIATSSQWQPLLSLDGDLKNQTRVSFKVERRVTQRDNLQLNASRTTDRNTDVNLNLSRSYSRGQKVKFLNKETTVKTAVSLSLAAVYSRQSGETVALEGKDKKPSNPQLRDRLSVNGRGSYSFSNNVTGNVSLGFGQTRNVLQKSVNRNVRVEVSASFTF